MNEVKTALKLRGCKDAALSDTAAYRKELREAAIELHCPHHVGVEGFNQALQFWWAPDLREDLEEVVSADQVKGLGEVDEGDVEGHLLFSALLLELAEREDHVHC